MLNLSCEVPVYSMKWMDEDEMIVCGGGEGKEIKNFIFIFDRDLKILLRYETDDNTLLRMDHCEINDLIIGTDMRKLIIFKLDRVVIDDDSVEYIIRRIYEKDVKANEYPDAEPKLCKFNNSGGGIAVANDEYMIEYFLLNTKEEDNILVEEDSVVLQGHHESVISCISFSENDEYLVSGDKDNLCCVWNLKERKIFLEYTPEYFRGEEVKFRAKIKKLKKKNVRRLPIAPKYRVCFSNFVDNELHLLHTTRSGPTYYSILTNIIPEIKEKKKEKGQVEEEEEEEEGEEGTPPEREEDVTKVCNSGCTCVSPLRGDADLVALGCSGEIINLYDLAKKRIVGVDSAEGCVSLTCCDVVKEVKEIEGREVAKYYGICGTFMSRIYFTKFKKKRNLIAEVFKNLMWIALVVIIAFVVGSYFEQRHVTR